MDSGRENQQAQTFYGNPAHGATIFVSAGGQVEAEFDFMNDSPDVAVFCLDCEGLPDGRWIGGLGSQYEVAAAASGGGSLRLTFHPTVDAVPGDYPFNVRILCGGAVIGSQLSLILRIGPAVRRESPPSVQAPAAPQYAPPPASQPAPPTAAAPPPAPQQWAQPSAPPVNPQPAPQAQPQWTPPPAQPQWTPPPAQGAPPPAQPQWNPPPAQPPAHPQWTPPAQQPAPPQWTPPPAAAPQPPQQQWAQPAAPAPQPAPPAWNPPPAQQPQWAPPPAAEEPMHMVDLTTHQEEHEQEPEQPDAPPTEPSTVSPRNGEVFPVRPGESVLVRFPFINTTPAVVTYVLDEDRSLPGGWITLVQDQVNISRGGEGELRFRLTPPFEADAGDYPFNVSVGPTGGPFTHYSFTLQVPVVPAVRLTSKTPKVTIGPFSRAGDVPFNAEIAGNADTAFRVSIKSREAGQETHDVYEAPPWRYIFDKELETLEAPTISHPAMPVPLRLRIERRGPWWLGFRESHTVRVEAVPVTEPGNGGKPGNAIDLTVARWRPLPIPLALFIPLLLLLIVLASGGAHSLVVTNAIVDEDGGYWAVLPAGDQKQATVHWNADRLALLSLTSKTGGETQPGRTFLGSGSFTDNVGLSNDNRVVQRQYRVGRVLGGGDQEVTVSYIYTQSDAPLLAFDGTTSRPLYGPQATLTVPANGFARLILKNGSSQFTRVDWWLADRLDTDDPYQFRYAKTSGSIEPGGMDQFLIERRPGFKPQDFNIMFITTDQNRPSFTVYLKSE